MVTRPVGQAIMSPASATHGQAGDKIAHPTAMVFLPVTVFGEPQ